MAAPADLPLPGGSPGARVRVHPLRCGETPAPPSYFERAPGRLGIVRALAGAMRTPRRDWPALPMPAFLLEHPTAGAILVDCGLAPVHAENPSADVGRVGALALGGVRMRPDEAIGAQARALGADPKLVVMTHLHYDHAGGSAQFADATFVIAEDEWADAPSPRKGTFAHHREAMRDVRTVRPGPFEDPLDLFDDGSVRLVATPGHTPGHLSLLLALHDGSEALLAADAAYARRTIDERLVPAICPDVETYLRSLDAIRAYVAAHPETVVVCGHDPWGWPEASATLTARSGS